MAKDDLYAKPCSRVEPFTFNEQVTQVFQDMIERSVPGYELLVGLSGLIAATFSLPGCRFYDLGCSLGATTAALLRALPPDGEILALDRSAPMVAQCAARFSQEPRVRVLQAELEATTFEPCDLVAMNFTLQFMPDTERQPLLNRLAEALRPGGGLLLAEKIMYPVQDTWHTRIHEAYKQSQGYSQLEIAQKRAALEQVLVRNDLATHQSRLQQAGFDQVIPWFQCLNFIALLAIR